MTSLSYIMKALCLFGRLTKICVATLGSEFWYVTDQNLNLFDPKPNFNPKQIFTCDVIIIDNEGSCFMGDVPEFC